MTIPSPVDGPLLLTDADVLQRVQQLVGPVLQARTLWLMFVDGDDRQAPVVMPIEEMPRELAEPAAAFGACCDALLTTAPVRYSDCRSA